MAHQAFGVPVFERGDGMAIQIEDIVNREFSREFLGYDMREVDMFLDAVIDRFEKLEAQRKQMLIAMEYLLKKLEATDDLSADVKKALANGDKALRRLAAADAEAGPAHVRGRRDAERQSRKPLRRGTNAGKAPEGAAVDKSEGSAAVETVGMPGNHPTRAGSGSKPAGAAISASAAATRPAVRVGRAKPGPAGVLEQPPAGPDPTVGKRAGTKGGEGGAAAEAGPDPVAVEVETHESAPDVDALIPELFSDLETALADSAIRAASSAQKDAPVRADEGRVS